MHHLYYYCVWPTVIKVLRDLGTYIYVIYIVGLSNKIMRIIFAPIKFIALLHIIMFTFILIDCTCSKLFYLLGISMNVIDTK